MLRRFPLSAGLFALSALFAATVLAGCTGDPSAAGLPTAFPHTAVFPKTTAFPGARAFPGTSAPLGGRRQAELDVTGGADSVGVHTAALGATLYRADTAPGSAVRPAGVVTGDTVTLGLKGSGGSGPSVVDITLNSAVAWTIRLDGGAGEERVDARSGGLHELDFGAGAGRVDVTLPRPAGTVPINLAGGASTFALHLPQAVPAQVTLAGGGGSATIDGTTHTGLAGGTVLTALDWTTAAARYTITCTAGVSQLTLDRT